MLIPVQCQLEALESIPTPILGDATALRAPRDAVPFFTLDALDGDRVAIRVFDDYSAWVRKAPARAFRITTVERAPWVLLGMLTP